MNRLAKILVCCVTASGGCAAATDDPWSAGASDGKADQSDGARLLKGSDIPSQYVDPNKTYIWGRFTYYLDQVGALVGAEKTAADKSDKIFPNRPRDEYLTAEELVELEKHPEMLTSAEQAALPALWALLEIPDAEQHIAPFELSAEDRSQPYGDTVMAVTEPGQHQASYTVGGITFTYKMNVSLNESRRWDTNYLPGFTLWYASMILTEAQSATLDADGALIVRPLGHEGEVFAHAHGVWPDTYFGGDVVLERFVSGQLAERHRITVVTFPQIDQRFLAPDFRMELADGTPLVRNLISAGPSSATGVGAGWSYDRVSHPKTADQALLDQLATPISSLAPGRYRVPLPDRVVTLELYSTGVVKLEDKLAEQEARDSLKVLALSDSASHTALAFVPATNQLRLEPTGDWHPVPTAVVTVTSAMRVP